MHRKEETILRTVYLYMESGRPIRTLIQRLLGQISSSKEFTQQRVSSHTATQLKLKPNLRSFTMALKAKEEFLPTSIRLSLTEVVRCSERRFQTSIT